jgi:hypothetical protein
MYTQKTGQENTSFSAVTLSLFVLIFSIIKLSQREFGNPYTLISQTKTLNSSQPEGSTLPKFFVQSFCKSF